MHRTEFIRKTEGTSGMTVTLGSNNYKDQAEEIAVVKEGKMRRQFERNPGEAVSYKLKKRECQEDKVSVFLK